MPKVKLVRGVIHNRTHCKEGDIIEVSKSEEYQFIANGKAEAVLKDTVSAPEVEAEKVEAVEAVKPKKSKTKKKG